MANYTWKPIGDYLKNHLIKRNNHTNIDIPFRQDELRSKILESIAKMGVKPGRHPVPRIRGDTDEQISVDHVFAVELRNNNYANLLYSAVDEATETLYQIAMERKGQGGSYFLRLPKEEAEKRMQNSMIVLADPYPMSDRISVFKKSEHLVREGISPEDIVYVLLPSHYYKHGKDRFTSNTEVIEAPIKKKKGFWWTTVELAVPDYETGFKKIFAKIKDKKLIGHIVRLDDLIETVN